MTPQQIKSRIQARISDKLWHEDFHGLDRAAKNALKDRIKKGLYFGKGFNRMMDIFELCGLAIEDDWIDPQVKLPDLEENFENSDEESKCLESKQVLVKTVEGISICYYSKWVDELGEVEEEGFYDLLPQDYISEIIAWKPLDRQGRSCDGEKNLNGEEG